jgi:hypothetical protein
MIGPCRDREQVAGIQKLQRRQGLAEAKQSNVKTSFKINDTILAGRIVLMLQLYQKPDWSVTVDWSDESRSPLFRKQERF